MGLVLGAHGVAGRPGLTSANPHFCPEALTSGPQLGQLSTQEARRERVPRPGQSSEFHGELF